MDSSIHLHLVLVVLCVLKILIWRFFLLEWIAYKRTTKLTTQEFIRTSLSPYAQLSIVVEEQMKN